MTPARRRLFRTIVGGATALMGLLVLEVGLRVARPLPDPYAYWKPKTGANPFIRSEVAPYWSATTVAEPGLPGMTGEARITMNNMGFRGGALARPKPASERRVFLIGGSAIECFYLDDASAIDAVLERTLRPSFAGARVYGAGKSGDASDDHVAMLAQRIVHLEPDLVLVMAGANDLLGAMRGLDYLHYPRPVKDRRGVGFFFKLAATEFQIGRRIHALSERESEKSVLTTITLRSDYATKVRWCAEAPPTVERPRTDLEPYARNLRTLVGIARANGFKIALATQPATWNSPVDPSVVQWHWMTLKDGVRFSEESMAEALDRVNAVTRAVGRDLDVPVLDLAGLLPRSLALFYDDCHFNPTGAAVVGHSFARLVEEQKLLAP